MSDGNPGPKEAIYDTQISPLMVKIIALCKEHRINMIADFALGPEVDEDSDNFGNDVFCTTSLPVDKSDAKGFERVKAAYAVLRPKPDFMAFTITTSGPDA